MESVTVHGAGVLGLATAWVAATSGHEVQIVEPQQPGAGASGRAAGIISTVCHEPDDVALVQATRAWLHEEDLFHGCGSLTIVGPHQADRAAQMMDRLVRSGEPVSLWSRDEIQGRWPGLHLEADEHALWVPGDGVTEPGDLVQRLHEKALAAGVRPGRSAGFDVLAAGAWSHGLLQTRGHDLPLAAFRTQAAHIKGLTFPVAVHDAVHGFYFRPDGQGLLVGDGTRLRPHDPETYNQRGDPEFEQSLASRLPLRLPDSQDARIANSWAGLCVGTPDARPVCGMVDSRTAILTGDNGHGVMRCIGLARRLVDALHGVEHQATSPARFHGWHSGWQLREGFAW